jgi:hypothetical protein
MINNNEKVCVVLVNPNNLSNNIVREMIKQNYKIVLVANKLEYYTNKFFDIWEHLMDIHDINAGEDKWEERLEEFISKYKHDLIINLTPIYSDKFEQNSKILYVLKKLDIDRLIFVNQFHTSNKSKDNIDTQVYKQYLYEILVTNYFKKYHIHRVGENINNDELFKNINQAINNQFKVTYPHIYRYKMLHDISPNIDSINLTYDNKILKKKDLYVRINKTYPEHIHSNGVKILLAGVFFKFVSHMIFICIRKFK